MGWIVVTRNPRSQKLVILTFGDELDDFAEFSTEGDANAIATTSPLCAAWGYEAVEITLPTGSGKD